MEDAAVTVVKMVPRLKIQMVLSVQQAVCSVQDPYGQKHRGDRRKRERDPARPGDEPTPEGRDCWSVEREEMP